MTDLQGVDRPVETAPKRAGFWRRSAALMIDLIIIVVPFQILVAALYPVTNGAIQISSGITYSVCTNNVPLTEALRETGISVGEFLNALQPPPPRDANFASTCRVNFFGFETARWLTIERITKEGIVTKRIHQTYRLDTKNNLVNAHAVDWIAVLSLVIYLITLEHRRGATLGKQRLRVRTIDTAQVDEAGIPLRKVVLRYIFMWIPVFPMIAVAIAAYISNGFDNETTLDVLLEGAWLFLFAASVVFGLMLFVWILVDIVCKHDPLYDWFAGTAVVHV